MVPELIDSLWARLLKGEYKKGHAEGTLYCYVYIGDEDSTSTRFEFVIARSDTDSPLNILAFNCKFD